MCSLFSPLTLVTDRPEAVAKTTQSPCPGRVVDAAAVMSFRLTEENSTRSRDSNNTDMRSLKPIARSSSSPDSVVPLIGCNVNGRVPSDEDLRLMIVIPPALSDCPRS